MYRCGPNSSLSFEPPHKFLIGQQVAFIRDFDNTRSAVIVEFIPIEDHRTTIGAIFIPPASHDYCLSLSPKQLSALIDSATNNTQYYVLGNKRKAARFAGVGITKENWSVVAKAICEKANEPGAITYFETQHDKYTAVMAIHVDQVVPATDLPSAISYAYILCVFGCDYQVVLDPQKPSFPKSQADREGAADQIWETYRRRRQSRVTWKTQKYKQDPTRYFKPETLKEFFPNKYDLVTQKFVKDVSPQMLHLAQLYNDGVVVTKVPVLCTLVLADLKRGASSRLTKFWAE